MSNPAHDADLDPVNGKYAPWVSLLREDFDYLRMAPAPAYWALAPYYVGQFTETACSLASAVMVVNAGRANMARSAGTKLITQPSLLDAVGSDLWRAGVATDDGHGVGLLQLQGLLAASFGIARRSVGRRRGHSTGAAYRRGARPLPRRPAGVRSSAGTIRHRQLLHGCRDRPRRLRPFLADRRL